MSDVKVDRATRRTRVRRLLTPRTRVALGAGALLLVLVAGLLTQGRVLVCTCGVVAFWSGDIYSAQQSQQLADPYSFSHIEHGLAFFWLLLVLWPHGLLSARLLGATAIEVGWELLENSSLVIDRYRETTISLGYVGDSVLNSVGDVGFAVAGFLIASRLSGRMTLFSIVALEIGLAVWIRDGVLLNIIMLRYPIDAIRRWQSAA